MKTKPIVGDPLHDLSDLMAEPGVDLNPSPPSMSPKDRKAIMSFLEVERGELDLTTPPPGQQSPPGSAVRHTP